MRGTLHVLPTHEAGAYLALLAAARTWEKGAWQRTFLDARQMAAVGEAAAEVLEGAVLTREELTDAIITRTRDASLAEHLRSGWGAVLKPLAWQGLLCYGPARDNRVTFTRPDTYLPGWSGLPDAHAAAPLVVERYLGAYGPATPASFDDWLLRGATPKTVVKRWFAELAGADRVVPVGVEGERLYANAQDAEDMSATPPETPVRLLPAFDQYVVTAARDDLEVIDVTERGRVYRPQGWLSPVVVAGGRMVAVWRQQRRRARLEVVVEPFAPLPPRTWPAVEEEAQRLAAFVGADLELSRPA
jgi:hypothetical protein